MLPVSLPGSPHMGLSAPAHTSLSFFAKHPPLKQGGRWLVYHTAVFTGQPAPLCGTTGTSRVSFNPILTLASAHIPEASSAMREVTARSGAYKRILEKD